MSAWGPQLQVFAQPARQRRAEVAGAFWVAVVGGLALGLLADVYGSRVMFGAHPLPRYAAMTPAARWLTAQILLAPVVLAFPAAVGVVYSVRRRRRPDGQRLVSVLGFVLLPFPSLAFVVGYGLGKVRVPGHIMGRVTGPLTRRLPRWLGRSAPPAATVMGPVDQLTMVRAMASAGFGAPGGHVGWTQEGRYISANPRGGVLVIGPPGSGKTSAFLIPSVMVAPGACVASSIKGDVMAATAAVRARLGTVWHFDPGGEEETLAGVVTASWSPLVSIATWEDARRMANRMAQPLRKPDGGESNGAHFTDRARDWLEVLLYAAVLGGQSISVAADWASNPTDTDDGGTVETVLGYLCAAEEGGDRGARIARVQLEGLLAIDARERSSITSTLVRMMRLYGSVVARDLGEHPNFDPVAFVRSADTLYITASPDRQSEYAPLISSLLEEIRFAVYACHRAQEAGREGRRPHTTFVLDEANNTAPIPLPAIISEAGGQSLHIIVGIQDMSRARSRWGKEADGFLTLFPGKVVLPGVIEPYTLDALSNAAGEYDRQMVSYSESISHVGQYSFPIRQVNPTYSTQRQKVLHQGDIASLPVGSALLFEGAQWWRVRVAMHWASPTWQSVMAESYVLPTTARTLTGGLGGAADAGVVAKAGQTIGTRGRDQS